MAIRVAISGFGRIGRLAFRELWGKKDYEIVAINDLFPISICSYLLKYDTEHHPFVGHTIEEEDGKYLVVDKEKIPFLCEANPESLPWRDMNVDVVVDCTGMGFKKYWSIGHINAGAKKVIVADPMDKYKLTIVYGVNHNALTKDDNIISSSSSATNCVALMAKALNDVYPIASGIVINVCGYTRDQMMVDAQHRKGDPRKSRAAVKNIVPNSTDVAGSIGFIIPELSGKLIASAQCIPTSNDSTAILIAVVKGTDITVDSVNAAIKERATDAFAYNDDPIVSSDILGSTYGSIFDATQTMVAKIDEDTYQVQVVAWYDKESGCVGQIARLIKHLEGLL